MSNTQVDNVVPFPLKKRPRPSGLTEHEAAARNDAMAKAIMEMADKARSPRSDEGLITNGVTLAALL